MRLFIAVCLSDEMKKALTKAQAFMMKKGVRGRYSPEENLHLTLAFIGEYGDPDAVLDAMESVPFEPFVLELDGFGNFDDSWWTGLKDSDELRSTVSRLRHTLAEAGIPSYDRRNYKPHITLIRGAESAHGIPGIRMPECGMTVDTISLMRSDRGKNSMIYTEIGCIEAERREDS